MNQQFNSTRKPNIFPKRLLLVLAMIVMGLPSQAADYVLAYVNGNTTYYLARNGTTGVQRVTTFDPATCIWSCASNTAGTTAGTLNNSNTYGYLYQTVNGTRYFLNASTNALGLGTNADNNNYYRWRTNGTYVYNRYSNNTSYYINLANGVARNTTANTASNARPYEVTTSTVESTSTPPTINGANVLTAAGTSNYTASGAAYQIGYSNYRFNNVDHYYDANGASFTGTPAAANVTYSWTLTSSSYASVNNSGVITVSSLPATDVALTLTVTATFSGGTPAVPAGTTLTGTKEITIQGTKPSAPTISVSGTSVTLSTTAVGTTSIRYTLDGTDPTATSGTVYNGTIDLSSSTNSPVTIKAVTVRSGNASEITEQSVTLTIPEPTITINGEAQTATITSSVAGATIYYTTDGSTPTTSSSQYSGSLSGLAAMTTIKAIAIKTGWNASPVASATVTIPSGVSGGTVTLFDFEDHTWTYYSGVDASVDGGNYNTNYAGKLYSPDPRNVKITYRANKGAVSTSESDTMFVYYKTIEKINGAYKYTVISNPFNKRPTGQGFGGWKIVSGGTYINGYNDGGTIGLDEELTLTNLNTNYTTNCTSAEIVLQATWVNANIYKLSSWSTTSNNNYTYNTTNSNGSSNGTYETNILVINRSYSGTITTSIPVTIMMVEPDGSTDYRNNYSFTGNITPNNDGVTKIEWAHWNPGAAIDARGRNFTIGRGMTMDGTRRALNGTSQTSAMNQVLKVESGNFSSFTSYTANPSSITKHWVVFGCDYDRAKGDNAKLTFTERFLTGEGRNLGLNSTDEMARVWSKSGSFMTGVAVSDAAAGNSYYIGVTNTHNNGHRYLEIEGGEWYANIAGGMGENHTATVPGFTFRMRGGKVRGSVYGAAAFANAGGTRTYIITGGTIGGWVAGGANGTQSDGGLLSGATYIYVGGKARVDSQGSTSVINRAVGGNVFGAGCGYGANSNSGQISLGTNVVVADNAYIERGVYGGGSYGFCNTDQTSNLYVTGGTVGGKSGGVNGTTYQASITGGVFGGACQNKGGTVNITMTGGKVKGGLYGGSNATGTISGSVTMNINGGQVGVSDTTANIHGGGYGSATRVSQNVEVTLGTTTQTNPGVTVYGDVYGGSALGYVNGTTAADTYHTYVTLNKGTINGSLYGGGLGATGTAANVYGPVQVKVYGGSVKKTDSNGANGSGGVYGANNINGAPQRSVTVDIYDTDDAPSANEYALFAVYGGGNQADYTYGNGYPQVTVHNCDNSIEYVYGGGNAAAVAATDVTIYGGNKIGNVFGGGNGTVTAANVTGNVSTKIYGGTIGKVFGGSNSQGTIGGTITVNVDKQAEGSGTACDMKIGEVYGGGNMADSNVGSITIGCTGTLTADHSTNPENIGTTLEGIGAVYGGANAADVSGNVNLSITSGMINRVFGGNNNAKTVSGTITVNINKGSSNCGWYVGYVYGGGNNAPYNKAGQAYPEVNIKAGKVSHDVFGAGKGTGAAVTGNPVVTLSGSSEVGGNVYGGGDQGAVTGETKVQIKDAD